MIKLPVNSVYAVTEVANPNYTETNSENTEGEITTESAVDSVIEIVFTNTFKESKVVPPVDAVDPTEPDPKPPTKEPHDPAPDPDDPVWGTGGGGVTDTEPEVPLIPAPPKIIPDNVPDPTSTHAPEEIIIVDELGVPLAYYKLLDPVTEEYIYVDELGVPLANMILDYPVIPLGNMTLMDVPNLPQTGQKENGAGILFGLRIMVLLGAMVLRKKEFVNKFIYEESK